MAGVAGRLAATQGADHPDTLQAERILSSMARGEDVRFGLLGRVST
jgi:hypothetical protein